MAATAGELLVRLRSGRSTGDALKDEGDTASQEHLAAELARRFPGDAVLSEESRRQPARGRAAAVWIIDPLDGTREFAEPAATTGPCTSPWSSTAGRRGGRRPPGRRPLSRHGTPVPVVPAAMAGAPRLVVSRTRPTAHAQCLRDGVRRPSWSTMGSAGAKAMAVVLGDADVYAHSGGQHEWDSAAPVAVAAAAGLHVSRFDGSPLRYNRPDPSLPDVLICRPELADAKAAHGARDRLVPLDAHGARSVGYALPEARTLDEPGEPHIVIRAHADGAVGTRADVGLAPDQVERPDPDGLPRPRVGGTPWPLGDLENEGEGRHEALQGDASGDDLGGERQMVEALAQGVGYRVLQAIGGEADVRVGEKEPLAA